MKFKIVFEVPGQLRKEATWDTAANPDLPDHICALMDGKAAIFDKRERATHTLVDGHQIAAEEYKTAMAQMEPKASGDPSEPTPIERLGGAWKKKQDALPLPSRKNQLRVTHKQAEAIAKDLAMGWSAIQVATKYNVTEAAVNRIWLGLTFKEATGFTPNKQRTKDQWNVKYFNRTKDGKPNAKGKRIIAHFSEVRTTQKQARLAQLMHSNNQGKGRGTTEG